MIKVYLDTCIVSKLIDDSFSVDELIALNEISENQNIAFVTATHMLEEINNTLDQRTKFRLKVLYQLLTKVEKVPITFVDGGFTIPFSFPLTFGTVKEDPVLSELKKIFKKGDPEHIFQAIKNNCDFFLTADYKTIINKGKKWKQYFIDKEIVLKIVDCIELKRFLVGINN